MSSYRPGDSAVRDGAGAVFAFLASVFVIGIIIVGGWQAGWWFRAQDTNRQAQLDRLGMAQRVTETNDHVVEVPVGDLTGLLNAQTDAELAAKTANGDVL